LAVIDVVDKGLMLREISGETDLETVISKTGPKLILPEGDLPEF
jgi:acyl CoA:acetate/3-ketoacid CoA transferase beta subunit